MNATELPTAEALKLLTDAYPLSHCGVDLNHTGGRHGTSFGFHAYILKDDEYFSGDSKNPIEAAQSALAEAAAFDPDAALKAKAEKRGFVLIPATSPA